MNITAADIRRLTPSAALSIVDGIVEHQALIPEFGITTPLRLCHFLAQLAHESAGFRTTREYASGVAYEGRKDLGNTKPGDGKRFRGRGLIQCTGRANAREAGDDLGYPYESKPQLMEQFPHALLVSLWFWKKRGLNKHADADNVVKVTKVINGGKNGLADRRKYLAKAKAIWLGEDDELVTPEPDGSLSHMPVIRKGAKGADVVTLQKELIEAGYKVLVDGDFGEHTDEALRDFQDREGLTDDGIAGAKTWAALERNKPGDDDETGDRAAVAGKAAVEEALRIPDGIKPVPATEDVTAAQERGKDVIRGVQERLRELQYFQVGNVDGILGDRTKKAILAFRLDHGLPLVAEIDKELLDHLFIPTKANPQSVSPARANAEREDVEDSPILQNTEAARRKTWFARILAALGIGGSVVGGAAEEALDPTRFGQRLDLLGQIGAFAADNWLMLLILLAVGAAIWWYLGQADRDIDDAEEEEVQAYREGRHV